MSTRKQIVSFMLISVLVVMSFGSAGCTKKPVTNVTPPVDPSVEIMNKIKAGGQVLAGVIVDGIALVPTLVDAQELDTKTSATVLVVLNEGKVAVNGFNVEAAKFVKFDVTAKDDLIRLFKSGIQFAAKLNAAGVTHIKNAQLKARVQIVLAGLDMAINALAAYLGVNLTQLQSWVQFERWIRTLDFAETVCAFRSAEAVYAKGAL